MEEDIKTKLTEILKSIISIVLDITLILVAILMFKLIDLVLQFAGYNSEFVSVFSHSYVQYLIIITLFAVTAIDIIKNLIKINKKEGDNANGKHGFEILRK